jgi:transposase
MWTAETRSRYDRSGLRYPSDLTDAEWELIAPLLPPAKRGGRQRSVDLRAVVQALLYLLETGCQWRHLPKDFPPKSTVWGYFDLWSYDGTLARIHEALYAALRAAAGRKPSPTAAIIDSQTVQSAEKGGLRAR